MSVWPKAIHTKETELNHICRDDHWTKLTLFRKEIFTSLWPTLWKKV